MFVYRCPLSESVLSVALCRSVYSAVRLCSRRPPQQTQDVNPMLGYCWPTVYDAEMPNIGSTCRVWRHAECGPASQKAGQH